MPGLRAFMDALRARENYGVYGNATIEVGGAATYNPERPGAYQFGLRELKLAGYLTASSTSVATGQWTGLNGVSSVDDWLSNPAAQDQALIELVLYKWNSIRQYDVEHYAGSWLNNYPLTMSGMAAAAHLVGEGALCEIFIPTGGRTIPIDGLGTPITEYLELFASYDLRDISGIDPSLIPANYLERMIDHADQGKVLRSGTQETLGTGDDTLNGFGGDDTVIGASGGDDFLDGGAHDAAGDTLSYAEFEGSVNIELIVDQSGFPQSSPHFLASGAGTWTDEFVNFETIVMTNSSDNFSFSAAAVDFVNLSGIRVIAAGGDDDVRLGTGADTIFGGLGDDTVDGGGGNDIMFAEAGADSLFGGGGDDFIFFDADDGANINGGEGRDVAVALGQAGVSVDMAAQALEVMIGGGGADTITMEGSEGVCFAAGGGGSDTFIISYGEGEGPRVIWGGGGADTIVVSDGIGGGIAVVSMNGLTEEMFATMSLEDLGLGNLNLGDFRAIVINPDSSDRFQLGGETFSANNMPEWVEWRSHASTYLAELLGSPLSVQGGYERNYEFEATLFVERDEYENVLSITDYTGRWLADLTEEVDFYEYDPNDQAEQDQAEAFINARDLEPVFRMTQLETHPHHSPGYGGLYVIGGDFVGSTLVSNGALSASAPADPGTTPFDWLLVA